MIMDCNVGKFGNTASNSFLKICVAMNKFKYPNISYNINRIDTAITICNIIDLLNSQNLNTYCYYDHSIVYWYTNGENYLKYSRIIELEPRRYYLHEQSQEVIDKIAELII